LNFVACVYLVLVIALPWYGR